MKEELNKDKRRVLLTSVAGLVGTYLTKLFLRNDSIRVVGIDMNDNAPLKDKLDAFYQVPANNDSEFLKTIKDIIKREQIEYIIPISSYDIKYYSRNIIQKELEPVKYMVVDEEVNNVLHYKDKCYDFLRTLGISTPKVFYDNIQYPAIIKPIDGSGSRGIIKVNNDEELFHNMQLIQTECIIVEYLEGDEFTVDCLFDFEGGCKGYNIRRREKIAGGGAVISRNDYRYDKQVQDVIRALEQSRMLKGPINFQFKIGNNKDICVFDFNTRLPSGGLPVTVESGFNIPERIIALLSEETVPFWAPNSEFDGLAMYRYYEEVFR